MPFPTSFARSIFTSLASLLLACACSHAVTAPPRPGPDLLQGSWGEPLLSPHAELNKGAEPSSELLAAWERLRAEKGAEQASLQLSKRTGLPSSVAYLKSDVAGSSLLEKAENFLATHQALFLKGEGLENLRYEKTRTNPFGAAHLDFLQYHLGLRVYGAGLTVSFNKEEQVVMVAGEYVPALSLSKDPAKEGEFSSPEALAKALRKMGGIALGLKSIAEPERAILSLSPAKGENRVAYRYQVMGHGAESHAILYVDSVSGEPLGYYPTVAYLDGTASVFDPHKDAGPPVDRTITDLDDSGRLQGALISVADEEHGRASSPSRQFSYTAESPEFHQASVYYYLSETRKKIRSLGLDESSRGSLPTIANALDKQTGGEFNNAFFTPLGNGFVFGNGDGVATDNLSIDFDVASHEYGHFMDGFLINTEQTALHTPRRAWGEACGDIVAAIVNGDPNIAETFNGGSGQPPLRVIDNTAQFPTDLQGEEHLDSVILSGAAWDFMEMLGGGTVTQAQRDEMGRVLFAGIPFIPMTNVQYLSIRQALIQGDMTRGGNNVSNLAAAFDLHGVVETSFPGKKKEDPEPRTLSEDKLANFYPLQNGVPVYMQLGETFGQFQFLDFYIQIPAGATKLTVQTFNPFPTPQGDVVLHVAPSNFAGPQQVFSSDFDFVPETIVVDLTTNPPLSQSSVWLIEVADFFDGNFSYAGLVATVEGGASQQIQQLSFNTPTNGSISTQEEIDYYFFPGQAGQSVDIAVNKTGAGTLDPLVSIGNSSGTLLGFDDNSGGNQNALIRGFTLPGPDNYLIAVQSAVSAFGPTSSGDYQITLSGAAPPPATPTPRPSGGGGNELTLGVPVSGSIGAAVGNQGGVSMSYKVTVPSGAKELVIQASEVPIPSGNIILQVRKGQPVGNTLDDYVGLGGRRSTVVVTPGSSVPLTPGDYYMLVFNLGKTDVNFELVATAGMQGGGGGSMYDSDSNNFIDAKDLVALILQNTAGDPMSFFGFAKDWHRMLAK